MKASEYREIIRIIVRKSFRKTLPELKLKKGMDEFIDTVAKNIHARLYGANVDNVASPLWRNENDNPPDIDASELLKELT